MGHVYSCESVLQSEIRVMKTLKFRVNTGHPLLYIETILEILGKIVSSKWFYLKFSMNNRNT